MNHESCSEPDIKQISKEPYYLSCGNEIIVFEAADVFGGEKKTEGVPSVKELHAKIGQLAMENDFLSVALGRIADPSAKR